MSAPVHYAETSLLTIAVIIGIAGPLTWSWFKQWREQRRIDKYMKTLDQRRQDG